MKLYNIISRYLTKCISITSVYPSSFFILIHISNIIQRSREYFSVTIIILHNIFPHGKGIISHSFPGRISISNVFNTILSNYQRMINITKPYNSRIIKQTKQFRMEIILIFSIWLINRWLWTNNGRVFIQF